ncbi:MAG TPA: DNA repair protein RecO [Bacteroidetes bacterium]|nr:DNA repair protein RecO [Bacteroidota bacterium]
MITKTDAVVLKSMKFRGTSKIVTFYSRRYGKLKGIAKGARETKSKFGAALEPMTQVALVLYKKEHRELQFISQCDVIRPYKKIHSEIERMSVTLTVLELINQLTHEEEENPLLYALLTETLEELELAPKNFINLFYAFEVRLCAIFGFAPSFGLCLRCGREMDGVTGKLVVFQLARGGLACSACCESLSSHSYQELLTRRGNRVEMRGENLRLSLRTARILGRLLSAKLKSVTSLVCTESVGNEIEAALRLYLRCHFENLRPLKSLELYRTVTG